MLNIGEAVLLKKAIALLMMLFFCTACSKLDKKYGSFKPDRNKAYLKEHEVAALKLPAGDHLDSRVASDRFPIPKGPRPAPGSEPISIIPPTLTKSVGEPDDTAS